MTINPELVQQAHAAGEHAFCGPECDTEPTGAQQGAEAPLVHVGWWCWRGTGRGHLATTACRSDNVPLHVPAEWADEMRAVLQRIDDGEPAVVPSVGGAALRDRIAETLARAEDWTWAHGVEFKDIATPTADSYRKLADAVLAVLPAPAAECRQCGDTGACNGGPCPLTPAAECSAQHRQFDDGRLCIRAAQHRGDHIDERGFHWSDTVAVYPVGDGAFRSGTNRGALLRRLAGGGAPGTGTEARRACACGQPGCEYCDAADDEAQQGEETPTDPLCRCSHRKGQHITVSGRLLCDACDPDSTDNLVCKEFDAL